VISLKTPFEYINAPGAVADSGERIAALGRNALIVGGARALGAAGAALRQSLEGAGVQYKELTYAGYCTDRAVSAFAQAAETEGSDILIGVGGGRILDTVKAVGEKLGLQVVSIPTVAGTCAAWSALSIIYDERGRQTENRELSVSPRLVVADTDILAKAPLRYFRAGIGDTLAKWYEYAPLLRINAHSFALKVRLDTSKLALDILEQKSLSVIEALESGRVTEDFSDVVDSVIFLAGLNGSIRDDGYSPAIAHAIHNSFTHIEDTHGSLHGEKVIFGLIVQFILQGDPEDQIRAFIDTMNKLALPVTLAQLGIKTQLDEKVRFAARNVDLRQLGVENLDFAVTGPLIEQAIFRADELGRRSFGGKYREKAAIGG
jgi:Glycerol dehydrogenase and related enzymes